MNYPTLNGLTNSVLECCILLANILCFLYLLLPSYCSGVCMIMCRDVWGGGGGGGGSGGRNLNVSLFLLLDIELSCLPVLLI